MQAIEMFAAFVRSADALERIANSLELIAASAGENTISVSATDGTATAPDNKRKRRTKAEIEPEKNGTAQSVTLPPEVTSALGGTPPFDVTAPSNTANPPAVQPPVVQPPVVQPPAVQPPAVQPPVVQPAVDPVLAQYAALPVEQQFGHLLNAFGPHNNVTYVRDALVNTATSFGLGLPFSDPADRNLPGAAYRALSNDQRIAIYSATVQAIAAVTAAQQPGL